MDDTDDKEQKHYAWNEGLPTGPDVTILQKTWPALQPGDRMAYEEVARALGIEQESHRFVTVTQAWRKREEEKGLVILRERGKAFFVATVDQITGNTYETLKHIGHSARKQRKRLGTIKSADESTRMVVEHQARLMIEVEKDSKTRRMNILPSLKSQDVRIPLPNLAKARA
jgi:hypothetical protein